MPAVSVSAATTAAAPRAVDPNLPASVETVTREQFGNWNVVNTEDVLKYMPNLAVRKRFIGDVNSLIAVRGTSNSQSARGLVYADGLLLSNLLGNSFTFPPRWSMVFPDEIQQVDVIYGPFSALYPGNSLGATVLISTCMPKKFEADADVKAFTQHFSLFGVNQNFNGSEMSASIGDRIGKFSYRLGVNHLENTSQPLQFATLAQSSTPAKAGATPVTGAYFYNNQTNTPTAVLGVNGEGIEHTVQDQFKLKMQYDFTPTLQAGFTLGYWHQTYNSATSSFLRDADGNPVYSGTVSIGGYRYTIPAAAFAPSLGHSENWLYGVSLKTRNATGWNGEAIASYYDIGNSVARTANSGAPGNGPGTVIFGDGTGWKTLDLRSTYTPVTTQAGLAESRAELRLSLRQLLPRQPELQHAELARRRSHVVRQFVRRQNADSGALCAGRVAFSAALETGLRRALRRLASLWRSAGAGRPGPGLQRCQPASLLAEGVALIRPHRRSDLARFHWPRLSLPDGQ